jgi:hypothetical protein
MKVSQLKANPTNQRIIKDDKFKKLVESLRGFPEMMEKRPMVCVTDVDGKLFPLGGNMRLRAIQELGMKEIPDTWVTLADDWTEEKRKEFTIRDNVGHGEWNWSDLANEWDADLLSDWGVDVPNWSAGHNANELSEDDLDMTEEFDPIGTASGLQRVVFIFDGPDEAESWLNRDPSILVKKTGNSWTVNLSTQST